MKSLVEIFDYNKKLLPNFNSWVPRLCFKKVWKICKVLNICVTAGHRPAQPQEEPVGWRRFSRFCLKTQKFFAKYSWLFCDGMCKEVLVLGIYNKSSRKVCSVTKCLRSQTKVWKLATLLQLTILFTFILIFTFNKFCTPNICYFIVVC